MSTDRAEPALPFWRRDIHRYDALEVHPVREFPGEGPGETWCEVCQPAEASFWSVYGHLVEGGVECFEDFPTAAAAEAFAAQVRAQYPHLRET